VGAYQSLSSLVTACRSLGVLGSLKAGAQAITGQALYLLGHPGALLSRLVTGSHRRRCYALVCCGRHAANQFQLEPNRRSPR
jgi:hypothetical protein